MATTDATTSRGPYGCLAMNGYSRDYYPKAVKEGQRVAERLAAVTGYPVAVRPTLVLTGVDRRNVP